MRLVASSLLAAGLLACFVAPTHGSLMMPEYPYKAKEFAVIKHQGLFHLFYMRRDVSIGGLWWVDLGHATSPDLSVWTQHAPVLPVRPLNWDSDGIWAPHVIQQGATFYMFYTALTNHSGYQYHQRIGVATSTDLFNWERLDAPVYECADAFWTFCNPTHPAGGDFRDAFVMPDPAAPGEYLMYHVARKASDLDQFLVGVARSTGDLTQWMPIMPLNNTHRFKTGSTVNESPHLLQHDGVWFLFYTTWNNTPICFQTSTDPLADSASWGPQRTLNAEIFEPTNDWFGSETFSDGGKDFLAAVNSDMYGIEFRELAWITADHFDFAEPTIGVVQPQVEWRLLCSPSRLGWDRLPIRIDAPHAARVRLEILDAAGRVRRALLAGRVPPGSTTLTWDGTDERGHPVASGIYFVSLLTPDARLTRRVVRVR